MSKTKPRRISNYLLACYGCRRGPSFGFSVVLANTKNSMNITAESCTSLVMNSIFVHWQLTCRCWTAQMTYKRAIKAWCHKSLQCSTNLKRLVFITLPRSRSYIHVLPSDSNFHMVFEISSHYTSAKRTSFGWL